LLLSLFYDRRSSQAGISGQHSISLFLLPHKNVTLFFSGRFILLRGKRFPDHYASFRRMLFISSFVPKNFSVFDSKTKKDFSRTFVFAHSTK